MGNFRQRIVLIHKLRQLRRAEELTDNRSNRFGVDQILRFDIVQNFRAHSFANGSFHAQQAHTVLVFHQFADRTDAAVAEMVNIVNFAFAVAQLDQTFDNTQNIVFAQRPISIRRVIKRDVQRNIHLYAADRRQVIALNIKEQAFKQLISGFIGRRFTRAHNAIDVKQSLFAAVVLVGFQRVSDIRTDVNAVDKQGSDFADLGFGNLVKQLLVQFGAGFGDNFAGFAVNHVVGQKLAIHLLLGNAVKFQPFVSQLLSRTRRQLFAPFQNHVAGFGINQIKIKLDTLHAFGNKLGLPVLFVGNIGVGVIEVIENFLFVHAFDFGAVDFLTIFGQLFNLLFRLLGIQRIQNGSDRQLAAAVDTGINQIFGVKFKIQPGTAVRNNAGGKQIFAGSDGFAFVMVKKDARRTVHLRNDDTLGTVENKRTFVRHQRNVAHIDILLLNVVNGLGTGSLVGIPDNQTQGSLNRCGIGHITLDTFVDIVLRLFKFIFDKLQLAVS